MQQRITLNTIFGVQLFITRDHSVAKTFDFTETHTNRLMKLSGVVKKEEELDGKFRKTFRAAPCD
jgi:hypothetical protein